MRVAVLEPPQPFIELEDAKVRLGLDGTDDRDVQVTSEIAAACLMIDGPQALLGRAVGQQTLELVTDSFGAYHLGLPDLLDGDADNIASVTYVDTTGVDQVWAAENYRVIGASGGSWGLAPVYDGDWPTYRADHSSIRVLYTAGFSEVPEDIVEAALLQVKILHDNPEGPLLDAYERARDALLSRHRVWSV